ncbi:hypothetical protein, partial [Leptospira meyeri]|uniref:hypothetical protein n=1 Tax=Leptospira meyeri TaxID=29508 RepID=UPI000CBB0BD5
SRITGTNSGYRDMVVEKLLGNSYVVDDNDEKAREWSGDDKNSFFKWENKSSTCKDGSKHNYLQCYLPNLITVK